MSDSRRSKMASVKKYRDQPDKLIDSVIAYNSNEYGVESSGYFTDGGCTEVKLETNQSASVYAFQLQKKSGVTVGRYDTNNFLDVYGSTSSLGTGPFTTQENDPFVYYKIYARRHARRIGSGVWASIVYYDSKLDIYSNNL